MREIIFTPQFHLSLFAIISFVICLVMISIKLISNAKVIESLEALKKKERWDEIKINIEEKGYFIHYPYPHSYTRIYGALSELQMIKASSFELESYKNRLKKEKIERESGLVTIYYRDDTGRLRNRISVSNNKHINYEQLISTDYEGIAYQNKQNKKLIVLRIPDNKEISLEKKRLALDSFRSVSAYIILSSIICIAALSI